MMFWFCSVDWLPAGCDQYSRGAGPRMRIIHINKDHLRKRGRMRPQKYGSYAFSQTFYISDSRVGDAKNGFRNDCLDAFYIDFVRQIHAKKYIQKIDLKTHHTISLNRVRSKFEEIIFLNVVKPKI